MTMIDGPSPRLSRTVSGTERQPPGRIKFPEGGCLGSPDLVSQEVTGSKCVPLPTSHQAKSGKQNLTYKMWGLPNGLKSRESSGSPVWGQKYFHRKFHHSVTLGFGSFGDN
jgi:hypothetical protein